jgi:hypothetical protein
MGKGREGGMDKEVGWGKRTITTGGTGKRRGGRARQRNELW